METILELLKSTLALFIIVDPIGILPFVASITRDMGREERNRLIDRTTIVGTVLLLTFSLAGKAFFDLFGISISSFLIAGGGLLVLLSVKILVQGGESWGRGEQRGEVFPLAFPLLVGPGAITTTIISVNSLGIPFSIMPVIVTMALTWCILRSVDWFLKLLRRDGADAIARIMAVFMSAIGVEYVIVGIRGYGGTSG